MCADRLRAAAQLKLSAAAPSAGPDTVYPPYPAADPSGLTSGHGLLRLEPPLPWCLFPGFFSTCSFFLPQQCKRTFLLRTPLVLSFNTKAFCPSINCTLFFFFSKRRTFIFCAAFFCASSHQPIIVPYHTIQHTYSSGPLRTVVSPASKSHRRRHADPKSLYPPSRHCRLRRRECSCRTGAPLSRV